MRSAWSGTRCSQPRDTSTSPSPLWITRWTSGTPSSTVGPAPRTGEVAVGVALPEARRPSPGPESTRQLDVGLERHEHPDVARAVLDPRADRSLGPPTSMRVRSSVRSPTSPRYDVPHGRFGARTVGPVARAGTRALPGLGRRGDQAEGQHDAQRDQTAAGRPAGGEGRRDQAEPDDQERDAEVAARMELPRGEGAEHRHRAHQDEQDRDGDARNRRPRADRRALPPGGDRHPAPAGGPAGMSSHSSR